MSNEAPTDALRLVPDCPCNRCAQEAVDADGVSPFDPRLVRMFCCVQCGNKRCPHATDHRLSCTGSNEAGQEGSSYGPPLKSAAPASPLPGGGLPADVVRLVVAARRVAYEGAAEDNLRALDIASEAFASRVPWEDEPDELPAAPTGEPK